MSSCRMKYNMRRRVDNWTMSETISQLLRHHGTLLNRFLKSFYYALLASERGRIDARGESFNELSIASSETIKGGEKETFSEAREEKRLERERERETLAEIARAKMDRVHTLYNYLACISRYSSSYTQVNEIFFPFHEELLQFLAFCMRVVGGHKCAKPLYLQFFH